MNCIALKLAHKGFTVGLAMILLCIVATYVVVSFSVWSLCRISAASDRLAESRANVIPFKRC